MMMHRLFTYQYECGYDPARAKDGKNVCHSADIRNLDYVPVNYQQLFHKLFIEITPLKTRI